MKKTDLDITRLKNCIETLKTCVEDYNCCTDNKIREYIEDACVKRFEYTIETSWKLMKKYLKLEYGKEDKELTMNNIFRYMEGYDFILSWEKWRDYYLKRNGTSHEYNKIKAEELLNDVKNFLYDVQYLYKKFEEVIEE